MNKNLTYLFLLSLSISTVIAGEGHRGHGRMQLTAEQKTCLESKLGPKDKENRPTREAKKAAFSACGIEKPKDSPPMNQGETQPASDNQQSVSE